MLLAPFSISALSASDTVLVNGHVYTANQKKPWAAAVAVTNDTIDAVGSKEEIAHYRTAHTKVIDLQGRPVIPGITDGHVQLWFGALALHGFNLSTDEFNITAKDTNLMLCKIKRYAAAHPKDPIVFGRLQFVTDYTEDASAFKRRGCLQTKRRRRG